MNFKSILILQAAGLGDVLFCQKIADKLSEKYKVPIIWPIVKHISWVKDYIIPNVRVTFTDYDESILDKYRFCTVPQIVDDILIVPLGSADQKFCRVPIMQSKYVMCNLDFVDWQKYINIKRNTDKEQQLFKTVASHYDEYFYVNKVYATPPYHTTSSFVNVNHLADKNIVEHAMIDGYNVFDWLMVAEKSKEIHTVSTGNFYIFEALKCALPSIHIYCRDHIYNLGQLAFLKNSLNKHWIFHGDY